MKDDYFDKLITQELNKTTEKLAIPVELRNEIKAVTVRKPRTHLDRLRVFLNRRIVIPLMPLAATVAIVIIVAITLFKGYKTFPGYEKILLPNQYTTINIGNVSIIMDKHFKGDDLHANH
jgi:hypothetical protein